MKEEIKELLKQRREITDSIERLEGTSYSKTREALLENILSLDEVLKTFAKKTV